MTYFIVAWIVTFAALFVLHQTEKERGLLEIYFLNVGQGDSFLVRTPDNLLVLVDTGREGRVVAELERVLTFLEKKIDLVIISHSDADHMEGVLDLMKSYQVDTLMWTGISGSGGLSDWVKENAGINFIRIIESTPARDLSLGCCVELDVLWPYRDELGYLSKNINETSISFILSYKDFQLLSSGDLSADNELFALKDVQNPELIDILKVGHHGSKTSTSKELLELIKPMVAVIQVGKDNSYGHPNSEVLARLEAYVGKIFRNDLDGVIRVETNGIIMKITTESLENFKISL